MKKIKRCEGLILAFCLGLIFAFIIIDLANGTTSDTVEIVGEGSLLAITDTKDIKERAQGASGAHYYSSEIDIAGNESSVSSTYQLSGSPYYHNRYYTSLINRDVGVQHTVSAYGLGNIDAESYISSSNTTAETDYQIGGTGIFKVSVIDYTGKHPVDTRKIYAAGQYNITSGIYEIAPPAAGIKGDWLGGCGDWIPDWEKEFKEDGCDEEICEPEEIEEAEEIEIE